MDTAHDAPRGWTRSDAKHDVAFTAFVDGLLAMFAPQVTTVFLVRVDNWFGPKWLGFSGKVMGALGVGARRDSGPVVPPFKPSRIISERRFVRGQEQWVWRGPVIHRNQTSAAYLDRELADIADDALFVWFSGNTLANGRGSVLVASTPGTQRDVWYVGAERTGAGWRLTQFAGAAPTDLLGEVGRPLNWAKHRQNR